MGLWGYATATITLDVSSVFKKHEMSCFNRRNVDKVANEVIDIITKILESDSNFGIMTSESVMDCGMEINFLSHYTTDFGRPSQMICLKDTEYDYKDESSFADTCRRIIPDSILENDKITYVEFDDMTNMIFTINLHDRHSSAMKVLKVFQDLFYRLLNEHNIILENKIFNISDGSGMTFVTCGYNGMGDEIRFVCRKDEDCVAIVEDGNRAMNDFNFSMKEYENIVDKMMGIYDESWNGLVEESKE